MKRIILIPLILLTACGDDDPAAISGGTIEITTVTTGATPDADGYTVSLDGDEAATADANGTLTLTGVPAGSRNLELGDVAPNCALQGANPRSVTVADGETTEVQISLSCAAAILGRIVFSTERDGNREIYAMNPDGTGLQRLTNHPATDILGDVSADGRQFIIDTDRAGLRQIYRLEADGTGATNLGNQTDDDYIPTWTRDGRVLFQSNRGPSVDVWIMDADGGDARNLTASSLDSDFGAHMSPDGSRILFSSNRAGTSDIWVMNADGSGLTNLTPGGTGFDADARWSPDGTRIAFSSTRDGNSEIYVMNADGSGATRLTNDPADDEFPDWSPDGTRIAFTSERSGNHDIWIMNANGSGATNLTNSPGIDALPRWTPDY